VSIIRAEGLGAFLIGKSHDSRFDNNAALATRSSNLTHSIFNVISPWLGYFCNVLGTFVQWFGTFQRTSIPQRSGNESAAAIF